MIYLNYLFVFFGLIIASYTDLKRREVDDWLSWGLFFLGILYHLFFPNLLSYFIYLAILFFVIYVLWYLGVFAGGDAKLYLGIGALIPFSEFSFLFSVKGFPFVLSLFITTILVAFPFGALQIFARVLKNKKMLKILVEDLKKKSLNVLESVAVIVSLFMVLHYFNLPLFLILPISFIFGFLPKIPKFIFLILAFPLALYLDFYNNLQIIISIVVISYAVWFIFKIYFFSKKGIFNYKKKVKDLEEGDLLAYPLILEKNKLVELKTSFTDVLKLRSFKKIIAFLKQQKDLNKQILINNRFAGGLTKEDIAKIKKYLPEEKELELKKTIALVPAILIAFVLLVVFGDFIWFFV